MFVFDIDCPNSGLGDVMMSLEKYGIRTDSRNGPVIRFPEPVCLQYKNPRRRLLDHPVRAANHFFHLFETMWMLAGSNLVEPLNLYNSGMKQYSDDGVTFAAPYGYRWRKHFGFDQLITAVEKLKANPEDRRIVIQMWDPKELRKQEGKDFACNQQILLDTRPLLSTDRVSNLGFKFVLDMTVTNRSNDLIYGAMGSNLYHFSFLHEWLAMQSGLGLGTYYQFSKNLHLYLENEVSQRCWENKHEFAGILSPQPDDSLTTFGAPLSSSPYENFILEDLKTNEDGGWLENVAYPVCESYRMYKYKTLRGLDISLSRRLDYALEITESIKSPALRQACTDWFKRQYPQEKRS